MVTIEVAKKAVQLEGLAGELDIIQNKVIIFCDSQTAICLAKNHVYHARTKYIDTRYHKLREFTNEDDEKIQFVNIYKGQVDNIADIMRNPVIA